MTDERKVTGVGGVLWAEGKVVERVGCSARRRGGGDVRLFVVVYC